MLVEGKINFNKNPRPATVVGFLLPRTATGQQPKAMTEIKIKMKSKIKKAANAVPS